MQSLDNAQDVTVCRNCLGFAGDVISQLDILTGLNRPECLARHKARQRCSKSNGYDHQTAPAHELSGLYECLEGCGEVYCSPRCRSEHWERCHRLLCVGPVSDEEAQSHPLVEFRVHAMQTNEIFLLVGEVMAQIATAFTEKVRDKLGADGSGGDFDDEISVARAPFADFVQEPWWDVAVARDGRDKTDGSSPPPCRSADGCNGDENACAAAPAAAAALPGTLRALCVESSALLRRAFARSVGPLPAPLEQALTAEMFGRVVGMFEQNNVGVRAPSPIPEVLRELLSASSEGDGDDPTKGISQEVLGEVAQLVGEVMDEEEEGEEEGDLPMMCPVAPKKIVAGDDVLEGSGMGPGKAETILKVAIDGGDEEGGEVVSFFPPLDGTALYPLICCMNHSCRPKCLVRYPGRRGEKKASADPEKAAGAGAASADPLVAELVLLEDVPAGEELTQSYVTRDMGLVERREALEDYGFFCMCPRCLEEEAMASS
ncbi:unnamed protein product [Ectocarpus sp. 8 AP-2014]